MYTTVIFLIVHGGNSFIDTYVPETASGGGAGNSNGTSFRRATAGHITFAVSPVRLTDEIGESSLLISSAHSVAVIGDPEVGECKGRAPEDGSV